MRTLSHDGFARTTLVRYIIKDKSRSCSWCGNKRQSGALFQYATQPDDSLRGRQAIHKGLFCAKACHDDYHG